MLIRPDGHSDRIDSGCRKQRLGIRRQIGDAELPAGILQTLAVDIAHRHELDIMAHELGSSIWVAWIPQPIQPIFKVIDDIP